MYPCIKLDDNTQLCSGLTMGKNSNHHTHDRMSTTLDLPSPIPHSNKCFLEALRRLQPPEALRPSLGRKVGSNSPGPAPTTADAPRIKRACNDSTTTTTTATTAAAAATTTPPPTTSTTRTRRHRRIRRSTNALLNSYTAFLAGHRISLVHSLRGTTTRPTTPP